MLKSRKVEKNAMIFNLPRMHEYTANNYGFLIFNFNIMNFSPTNWGQSTRKISYENIQNH